MKLALLALAFLLTGCATVQPPCHAPCMVICDCPDTHTP